jgi:hypothetical protein
VLTHRWGFDAEDITVPTYVWHGEEDRQAPLIAGRFFVRSTPDCDGTFYLHEGHSTIQSHRHSHGREIFGAIAKAAETPV